MISAAATVIPQSRALRVTEVGTDWLVEHGPLIEQLCAQQDDPTPFQTWEWLGAWWGVFADGIEPRVVAVWSGDDLIALVPLMHVRRSWVSVLEWLGAGRSDHAPLLVRPGFEGDTWRAVLGYLQRTERRTDLLSLRTLRRNQLAWSAELPARGLAYVEEDVSPRVDIDSDWDSYLSRKSKKHRGNIRRLLRDQERLPALHVACVTSAPAALQAEIREVEAHSWKARGGSLRMEGKGAEFYTRFLSRFAERGWLEVWTCRFGATLLAYLITFHYRQRIFYYNGAYRFDYERYVELAPGTVLIANALKSAHDRGLRSFDFLRGDEPYKALWATDRRPLYHALVPLGGWRGDLAGNLVRARWRLRRYAVLRRARDALNRIAGRRAG